MVDTIFILNRNKEVIEVLSNNGAFPDAPFFDDTYVQILDTGAETYDFSTFSNTRTSNALVEGNYVLFCYDNKYKLFQIIETVDEHTSTGKILTCHCEIAGLELLTDYCEPFKIEGNAITFFNTVLQDTNWNVGKYSASLETNIQSVKVEGNQKVYTVIQENLAKFGGIEIEYRVEFKGNTLIGFFIDLYDNGQRGNKVYNRFEYGENIKGITRQKSLQDFASASIGEGKNGLNFKDIEWRLEWGNPADKPLGQNFVVDIEANNLYNKHGKYIKDVYKSDTEDARTLLEETWEHLQEVKKPKTDYEVDLGVTNSEYENMRIGDTNYVLDFDYNPPMLLSARIGKLELSFSDYTKNKCTLSNYKELKSFLHSEDRIDEIISSYFPITGEFIDKEAIGEEHIKTTYIQKLKTDIIEAGLVEVKVLIADKADITDLGVLNASIEYLKAHKADIEVLNAAMGNIDTLTSKLAHIETLVNGNLTSDNIHSLILTSSKVTVENGFIKNAMIESLSATKINTGILNTNLVNIQSEDGSLTLKGNLQQFKDKNGKVRIQMGKDATGNFTFAIFDETGTGTLIDSTGVKAKAIGNGIIVNDMISNNAGISGNKLDINSVVTSINNGTTNISGTKIQLNEKKQTLEVAFNSMSSAVTEQGKTIGSHTTSINALKGNIETLISDTTIVEEGNNIKIKDAFSSLKQEVGTISSKVSQVESDFDDVNANVQITVKSVKPQYYLSTSTTSCVGGTWQDTSPAWTQGKYMWQRLHYTYVNGTTSTGKETCIAGAIGDKGDKGDQGTPGATGATGATGQSVTSITPQYVAHTSSTTAPTSGWSDSCPEYSAGKFLWTRSKVIYANPSATKYTNPVYEPSWEAKNVADSASKTVTAKVSEFTQDLDGFKAEVSKTYYNKNEIDGKGYQTSSQVQQTVDKLEVKFEESGGYNLIRNSAFKNGSAHWTALRWDNQAGGTNYIGVRHVGDQWTLTNRNSLDAYVTGLTSDNANRYLAAGFDCEKFKVKSNTTYTLHCLMACHRVDGITIEMLCYDSSGNRISGNNSAIIANLKSGGKDRRNWTVVKHVFTTQSNAVECHIRVYMNEWTGEQDSAFMWIAEPIVVEGDKDVIWTPSADEVYDGITTIDKDGIKVSMQDGEGSQGYTRIAHDGMEIFDSNGSRIAHFGDSNTAYISTLTADKINNRHLLRWNEGRPRDLYVAPNATGDGTGRDANNKANSISNALNWLWNTYGCYSWQTDITIHLAPGDYWGADNYIGGWIGTGVIYVIFEPWAYIRSTIRIEECSMTVVLKGSVDPYNIEGQDNAYLYLNYDGYGIYVRNSTVVVAGLNMQCEGWYGDTNTWGDYRGYGVYATDGSNVLITNCDIVGFWYGCSSTVSSYVSMLNCAGHVGCTGVARDGGILSYDRALPMSKDGFWRDIGGFLWNSGGTWTSNSKFYPKPSAPQPSPPPPVEKWVWTENTFWASSLWTSPEGSGSGTSSRSGCWGQGKWGSYKPHRGYASFSGVNAWCDGGRNFTVELTMTRQNTSHGYAGAVPVPKIKTTNGSFWNCGQAFARGATHTITLPSDVANALVTGGWTNLEMWAGTSTNDYSFYDNVRIRVICEKRVQ